MGKVNTNEFGLRFAPEVTLGTAPTSGWRDLEPNNVGRFGVSISTEPRRPISPIRGKRKGVVVDSDSAVEHEADLTMESLVNFAEGFVFAEFANVEFDLKYSSGTLPPPAVAATDDFTVDSVSTLLGGKLVYDVAGAISLVYAKGYSNAANNGLFALSADVAPAATAVPVTGTLVDETPSTKASLEVAGLRCAIGDLAFTVSGSTATIVSAADITDWSVYGLFVGQYIHVGSNDGSGGRQNMFDDGSGGDVYGYARITAISGATLTLDKLDANLDTTDASNATAVDIMFGRFLRNVATDADSDDERYLSRSYAFEGSYPGLGAAAATEYEYAVGNLANELSMELPLNGKATGGWNFIGTDTEDITATRKTGPSASVSPLRTVGVGTAGDIASLTTDVVSAASDVCFKNLTLTIRNNVSPEKCLGSLAAFSMNVGLFEVGLEGTMLFTNKAIINAIKNNTTVTFAAILKNDDGAVAIDMPAATFGDGGKDLTQDEAIKVNITGEAFNDPAGTIPDVSVGISFFASVPTDRS
jgi:hypothetical protein